MAEDVNNADIAIFLSYGIGDPKVHTSSYSLPQWGQTGVASSTTYGTLNTYGNHANFTGTTSYTPQYGIVGYNTFSRSHYEYFRWMLLDAYDLAAYKNDQKIKLIWQTSATSVGSSDDLRLVFPVMAAATTPFIGTSTGKKILIKLHDTDNEVLSIRGTTIPQESNSELPKAH